MERRALGKTGLAIGPLVFGGNVLGWTMNAPESHRVLDAFIDHGFNAIDTADVYTAWVAGNSGGESEAIIGDWLRARPGLRDKIVLMTKVGSSNEGKPLPGGLSKQAIAQAVEASLRRLQTDVIDVYFSHWQDPSTPVAETLQAYNDLLRDGKIRSIGASNIDAVQLDRTLTLAVEAGLPGYQVVQPEYNLMSRASYDGPLRDLCLKKELAVVSYYSLASGFLTGKYRSRDDLAKSARGRNMGRYMNDRGDRVLKALSDVANANRVQMGEVALAWLLQRKGITAPIASGTSIDQVRSFAIASSLRLSETAIEMLDIASEE
ncbi:aldo/keto reductase [Neorhizobium galegae]|uniref:aldo/keto reductase n=1 Tax=Neorhizobium galegae TaxID=399 RepID=UPI001282FAD7|nr:aldo/keto reductase [Neorhizobium galegae]KAA9384111.1 aldo/keto reductase [Neorhizobium galegae]MCM2498761.1 aldo/keto reductase [Neorhizobium galegae]